MSVTPTSIPPISGSWQNSYTLAWRFSSTGYEYYGFQQSNGSFLAHERNIRVNTSTNVWEDGGTTSPDTISESNGVISCFNSTGLLLYSFTKPTTASWISSGGTGGGTSTEGVTTLEWTALFSPEVGSSDWRWTVTGYNSDAADYIYLYDEMPTLTSSATPVASFTFSQSSTSSTQSGVFTPDETKTYYVINYLVGSSSTNLNAVVLATKSFGRKKVSLNFW